MDYRSTLRFVALLLLPVLASLSEAGEIHDAIKAGDLSAVESILTADPGRISARDEIFSTPLHVAVLDSQPEIVNLLIARGADVNAGDIDDSRPLLLAAIDGKRELVEVLLRAGADLDAGGDYGNSPLTYAVYVGRIEIAELLLDRGADIHHVNTSGQIALQFAVAAGNLDLVKLLVARGSDINHHDSYGLTPLFTARARDHKDIVRYLEGLGAVSDYEIGKAPVEKAHGNFHVVTVPLANDTNCGVQSGPDGFLLVDTGYRASAGPIKEALAGLGGKTVTYIITTHLHGDHFGGHRGVDSTACVIDFQNLDKMVADGILTKAAEGLTGRTGKSFAPHYSMNFNGEEIRLIPAAGSHSDSDMLIWFTGSDIVCTGSLLVSEAFPACPAGKIDRYFEILDTMIDVFPQGTKYMPGHGHPIDMSELRMYRQMALNSASVIRKETANGTSVEEMLASDILAPWSKYGDCEFMPYQTDHLWISVISRTYAFETR